MWNPDRWVSLAVVSFLQLPWSVVFVIVWMTVLFFLFNQKKSYVIISEWIPPCVCMCVGRCMCMVHAQMCLHATRDQRKVSDVLMSFSVAGHLTGLRHCLSMKPGVHYFSLDWLSRKFLGSVCLSYLPPVCEGYRQEKPWPAFYMGAGIWNLSPHAILTLWAIFPLPMTADSEDCDFMIPSKLFSFSGLVLGVPSYDSLGRDAER